MAEAFEKWGPNKKIDAGVDRSDVRSPCQSLLHKLRQHITALNA